MYLPLQKNYRSVQPVSIASGAEKLHHPSDSESSGFAEFQDLEMRMLRIFVSMMIAAVSPLAAADGEGRGCSNATLKGEYGFILTGTKPSGPPPAPLEQMIGLALTRFDGAGNSTGTDNIHSSISGLAPDRPGTGTYSIKEDCTGVFTLLNVGAPPLEGRLVVVDKGKEVRTVTTSPATVMVTGIGRKL